MKNKVHLQTEKPEYAQRLSFYKKAAFGVCGKTDVHGDNMSFTDKLDDVTCLQCVQKLFKDEKISLVWKQHLRFFEPGYGGKIPQDYH